MVPTTKESGLLKDLKGQEKLCIEKYDLYAEEARSEELQTLFSDIANREKQHLTTIESMMRGQVPSGNGGGKKENEAPGAVAYENEEDRERDAFLCADMLATEKHASALYDTCVFEFTDADARRMLNLIQTEEQEHGKKIYDFMSANGMYN